MSEQESNFSVPKVYNFSLSEEFAESCTSWQLATFKIENPSFAVLLDHALAVIWHIFTTDDNGRVELNRSDIAWTLKFLEAIDLTNVGDTSDDLDALKTYMRKMLITRYSSDDDVNDAEGEDDDDASDSAAAALESTTAMDTSSTFLSLSDYLNFSQVIDEMSLLESEDNDKQKSAVCSDEQLLARLQSMNPSIKTLEDVSKLIVPEQSWAHLN